MTHSRRAFEELGRFLVSRGFEMLEESSSPQPFGSHYVVYERDSSRVRIIWDGKEEWLWVQELLNERDDRGLEAYHEIGLEEVGHRPVSDEDIASLKSKIGSWLETRGSSAG